MDAALSGQRRDTQIRVGAREFKRPGRARAFFVFKDESRDQ